MELAIFTLAALYIALFLWVFSIQSQVKTVLNYSYLELLVEDAIEGWIYSRTDNGIDVTEAMEELSATKITEDVLLIAWKYPTGSFEDRIREATEDLLDAWFPARMED